MKRNLCLLALLCLFFKLPAQENQSEKRNASGLAIGDQVPEVRITNILNHPTGEARLSDYRGKWLILDFWATWCSPCITAFPKTHSLQEAFKEELVFLPVTYEAESKVAALFGKLRSLENLRPPMVTGDSALHALFPHRSLPHYVWIDPEGTVAAITGTAAINTENINSMLSKEDNGLALKEDAIVPFDRHEPLLAGNRNLPEKPVLYQSAITGYMEGLPGAYSIFPAESTKGGRILATNLPLLWLYGLAYGEGKHYFSKNRVLLEVQDSTGLTSSLSGNAYKKWLQEGNGYCYELIFPAHMAGQEYKVMQEDLESFFPQYRAKVEIRERPVLALVRTSNKDKLASRGGKNLVDIKPYGARLRNQFLGNLVMQLNVKYFQHLPTPVTDHTYYIGRIDLDLKATMSNVEEVRKALQAYDLDLVPRKEEIKVLVISDSL